MSKLSFSMLYFLCGFFVLWLLVKTLKKKDYKSKILAGILFCSFIGLVSYALTLTLSNYRIVTFFYMLLFVAMDFAIIFLCGYTYYHVDIKKEFIFEKVVVYILATFDALILILNPFLNEFLIEFYQREINGEIYIYYNASSFQSYFYIHLAFLMFFVVSLICFVIYKCIKFPIIYCEKYFYTLVIVFVLGLLNILYYTEIIDLPIDISYFLAVPLAYILFYYNNNHRPAFFLSRVRRKIIDYLKVPFVMFDNEGILIDMNRVAVEVLPIAKKDKSLLKIEEFKEKLGINLRNEENNKLINFDVILYIDGEETNYHGEYEILRDNKNRKIGEIFLFHYYTKKELLMEELDMIANFDELTGLPNEYNFTKKIEEMNKSEKMPLTFVTSNINEMKLINDIFGDETGDEVVKFIASAIKKTLPRKNYIARINNDFITIMPNTKKEDAKKSFELISEKVSKNKFFEMGIGFEFGIATTEEKINNIYKIYEEAKRNMLKKKSVKNRNLRETTIDRYKNLLSQNIYESHEHCNRIMNLTKRIAHEIGLDEEKIGQIEMLSLLHDVGKLSIPTHILNKADSLNENEWEIIKGHTAKGYIIAKSSGEMGEIAYYILSHHERWDGKGYPNGLKGEDIPKMSRILAVVDAYDVMTHDRPYRPALSKSLAMGELKSCSGTQFDPEIVDILLKLLKKENQTLEDA